MAARRFTEDRSGGKILVEDDVRRKMGTLRAERETKRREPEPKPAPADAERREELALEPAQERVLDLQQSAGNAAVAVLLREPAAGAALVPGTQAAKSLEIHPVVLEQMRADVDRIEELLKKQILWASEESEIVSIVEHWSEVDRLSREEDATTDTRNLDKLLLLLKTRTFARATARSAWQDTWVNAYDTLWYELEDDRLDRFKAVVARSQKQATAGPESEASENVWATIGKHEAMGVWGMLKGLGLTLSGVADAVIWWQWKSQGLQLRQALTLAGVKVDDQPPQISGWLEKNYDEVAALMGREMGVDPTKDETLLGQSSYEIGEFGGKVIGQLVAAEAGGAALGVVQAGPAVDSSMQKIGDRILAIREQRPNATWSEILTDEQVLLEMSNIVVTLLGVFGSFGDAAPTFKAAFKTWGIPIKIVSVAPLFQRLWVDYNDPKLQSAGKEVRDKAIRDDLASILGTIGGMAASEPEGKGGKEGGGGEGGGGGEREGGGGGGGGGDGGESPFGPAGGDLGGELLEPHPVDPETGTAKVDATTGKSLPEFVPDVGVEPDPAARARFGDKNSMVGEPPEVEAPESRVPEPGKSADLEGKRGTWEPPEGGEETRPSLVRFEPELDAKGKAVPGGGADVTDVFRRDYVPETPKGTGGDMIAATLKAHGVEEPPYLRITKISEDQPTVRELANNVPPQNTVLGRALARAVQLLGGDPEASTWSHGEERGKPFIRVDIVYPEKH